MKYNRQNPPPDPENWSFIQTREGNHYRRKRNAAGKAVATANIAAQSELMKIAMPAASKLRRELEPFLTRLVVGRLNINMAVRIAKGLKKGTWPDYSLFKGLIFQPRHRIGEYFLVRPKVEEGEEYVTVRIPIPLDGAVRVVRTKAVTGYTFTLVMLAGDPLKDEELTTTLRGVRCILLERKWRIVCFGYHGRRKKGSRY